jgi:hypothetical protein
MHAHADRARSGGLRGPEFCSRVSAVVERRLAVRIAGMVFVGTRTDARTATVRFARDVLDLAPSKLAGIDADGFELAGSSILVDCRRSMVADATTFRYARAATSPRSSFGVVVRCWPKTAPPGYTSRLRGRCCRADR